MYRTAPEPISDAMLATSSMEVISQRVIPYLENKYNIDILLAVESGSRMWGYASPDSDYDVRFIYRYRDPNDRIALDGARDTIVERGCLNPLIDADGWDIVKAINLMRTGNGTVVDWLGSPIVYAKHPRAVSMLRMLQGHLFRFSYCRTRYLYHHRGLIHKSLSRAYDASPDGGNTLPAKQVLYAVRSALIVLNLTATSAPSALTGWARVLDEGRLPAPNIEWYLAEENRIIGLDGYTEIRELITAKANGTEKGTMFTHGHQTTTNITDDRIGIDRLDRITTDVGVPTIRTQEISTSLMMRFVTSHARKRIRATGESDVDLEACDAVLRSLLS